MEDRTRIRNITELAQLAGVSPGTVSRALADSHLIARKTRERIQAIAREHDFTPNALARNLRTRRTGAIAVVIPAAQKPTNTTQDPICVSMLASISSELTGRGYDLLLLTADESDPRWLNRVADSGRCDGIIVLGDENMQDQIGENAHRDNPVVAWAPRAAHGKGPAGTELGEHGRNLVHSLFRRISANVSVAKAAA